MAATVRMSYFGGAGTEPAGATAESGITFSRSDALAPSSGTAPVPVPTSAGTNYSWIMQLALEVTGTDSTSLSNRRVRMGSAITAGLHLFFQEQTTYRQPASGNKPSDDGSTDGATPAGYTEMTTSNQVFDSASVSAGSTGRNGDFCESLGGVASNFAGGGGQASLPDLIMSYDEA